MAGLQVDTISFLKQLKDNNNKEWFDVNRKKYDLAKADFITLTAVILDGVLNFDPSLGSLAPKDTVFRINRDVRFSANKSPYKSHFACILSKGGKKSPFAGYYFHCEPGNNSFVAGGLWQPLPDQLASIRQEIDYNFKDFKKVINSAIFKDHFNSLQGEKLKTTPKGYDTNNAAIEYIKHKSFIVTEKIADTTLKSESLSKTLTTSFKAMLPLIKFLNKSIE
jgi:uncharacterized protein (TIGR02453 family)